MFYRPPTSIHPTAPIKPSSEILKRSTADIDELKARRIAKANEFRETTKLMRPEIGEPSARHHEVMAPKGSIGYIEPAVRANRTIGGNPGAEAQRQDDIKRVLAGEDLAEVPDVQSKLNRINRESIAIEDAIKTKEAEFKAEFIKLSAAYCAKLRPYHDEKMKQFFKSFGEAFSIYSELEKTKRDLVDSSMGYGGLFGVNLDFMRGEDVREMFNEGIAAGYVASVPKDFQ
jgi:hypothetical protein